MSNIKDIEYIEKTFRDAHLAGWTVPGWYFWDETQAYCHGPYDTEEKAKAALQKYVDDFLSSL